MIPLQYQIPAELVNLEWFRELKPLKRRVGNPRNRKKIQYADVVTAFDIETTNVAFTGQNIMYVWQWAIGTDKVIIGHSWETFRNLAAAICETIRPLRMVVLVHNLSYEWQYLRTVIPWEPEEVFLLAPRKMLRGVSDCLEFRCTLLHSGLPLSQYLKNYGAEHQKLDGDVYDYGKQRFPWSSASEQERQYQINDVLGLVEAYQNEMRADGDDLYTVPLTVTGYMRRAAKEALRPYYNWMHSLMPTYEQYVLLRRAFRGGNCHGSRWYAGTTLRASLRDGGAVGAIHSYDYSSSYPAVIVNCKYPVTPLKQERKDLSWSRYLQLIERGYAVLMCVRFVDIKLKDDTWGCPYLSRSKCDFRPLGRNEHDPNDYDNGRVLYADYIETVVTDVDMRIIESEYEWRGEPQIVDLYYSRYGYLPDGYRKLIIEWYKDKCAFKGDPVKFLLLMRIKGQLNAGYGFMAQDPLKMDTGYDGAAADVEHLYFDKAPSPEEYEGRTEEYYRAVRDYERKLLADRNQRAVLPYQFGVWTTAHARERLERAMQIIHEQTADILDGFVYGDTDSVKFIGDVDFSEFNAELRALAVEHGATGIDAKGRTHYLGELEDEFSGEPLGGYYEFRTLGAKKYVTRDTPTAPLKTTIAGVSKKYGGAELEAAGGIDAFVEGFTFDYAGGTEHRYNDFPEMEYIEIDGNKIPVVPNIVIKASSYTVSTTNEYATLLRYCGRELEMWMWEIDRTQ